MRRSSAMLPFVIGLLGACDVSGPADVVVGFVSMTGADTLLVEGGSVQLSATPYSPEGVPISGLTLSWTSTAPSVATVTTDGLVQAVAAGSAEIRAGVRGGSGSYAVTVTRRVVSVEVAGADTALLVGDSVQLSATPMDPDDAPVSGHAIFWTSTVPAVATVTVSGLVRAVAAGSAEIRAMVKNVVGIFGVTVTALPVASVEVLPESAFALVGATRQFTAVLRAAEGRVLTSAVSWSSSDTTIARVSVLGEAVTVRIGVTTIQATSEGVVGLATLVVQPPPPAGMQVWPNPVHLAPDDEYSLAAWAGTYVGIGVMYSPTVADSWSSSDTTRVTVSTAGRISARAPGSVTISAVKQGVVGTGIAVVVGPATSYASLTAIDGGGGRTCGVRIPDSRILCWGVPNPDLGPADVVRGSVAVLPGAGAFTSVSVGGWDVCAIRTDAALLCWTGSSGPVARPLVAGWRKVAVSNYGGCALGLDSLAYCWSRDYWDPPDYSSVLAPVSGDRFTAIDVNSAHTCGLRADSTALCWGRGAGGRLGTGDESDRAVPTLVAGLPKIVQLVTGESHTCAIDVAGATWCWGTNGSREIGDGTSVTRLSPVQSVGVPPLRALALGRAHSCGLTLDGTAWCWGTLVTGAIESPVTFEEITAGQYFACGRAADSSVWCWGLNLGGWLGDGTVVSRWKAVRVRSDY